LEWVKCRMTRREERGINNDFLYVGFKKYNYKMNHLKYLLGKIILFDISFTLCSNYDPVRGNSEFNEFDKVKVSVVLNGEEEYHCHIQNNLYLGQDYILFPGNYQGIPNAIS